MAKAIPTILVIFGATGDLMQRKIAGSLWELFLSDNLPPLCSVIGLARRDWSDERFRDYVESGLPDNARNHDRLEDFLKLFSYHSGNFNELEDYKSLSEKLGMIDNEWQVCANKLFYLAVPPRFYETIFNDLSESGLTEPCGPDEGWTRILVEKPFGKDLAQAAKLDRLLDDLFEEEQIYRIDHFLAKEVLQNIIAFRFGNNLLEHVWDTKHIERIQIRLLEDLAVENRGGFYDSVGALRDVGQNHLLQMLALTAMDTPESLDADAIRKQRAEILVALKEWTRDLIEENTRRGQYHGYREVEGVADDSDTETYFRLKTEIDLPRWRNVPIELESGKNMDRVCKEVRVLIRTPEPCLFCDRVDSETFKNEVVFRLEPDPGISLTFWSKKPGPEMELEKKTFEVTYTDDDSALSEYAKILLDCMRGDQTLFVSSTEALASWRFIDPIYSAWEEDIVELERY